MELDPHVWGPVMTGAAALILGWLAFGKRRPKATASTSPRAASVKPATNPGAEPNAKAAASAAPAAVSKAAKSSPKAIVWEVPRAELADEDITVLNVIPPLARTADISVTSNDVEGAEDQASRIQLSYEENAEPEEITATSARILLHAAGDSDQGRVRVRNEDSMLVMPERSLFAVADGMGGHRGGAVASSIAIDALQDAFARSAFEGRLETEGDVPRRARELAAAVQMTNECVRSMALADRELSDMGTTLVAARFSPNKQRLYIGHVGDSRCYRLRRGTLRQLTIDHTMASLGMKGPRGNDLYQAIGVSPGLVIDLIVDKPQDDDIYLLCSDGLSKMLSDERLREVLLENEDLESAIYTLIEETNDRGGKDNVTVIIVKVLAQSSKKAIEAITKKSASN